MRILFFFLLSLVVLSGNTLSGNAVAEEAPVNLAGIGGRTCTYWLSSRDRRLEGSVWIYGFWSGLNYVAVSSRQQQSRADDAAMIAAVEANCKRQPSQALAAAAWSAYLDSNVK
jgi:hypothetical protein